jgi:co-chaperonin GroES (HSP10)
MIKIKPEGAMLIVFPLPSEETKLDSGIITQDFLLTRGQVLEVSKEFEDKYKEGDIILFPEGAGKAIQYQKKSCLWVNGVGFPDGEVFGIVTETKDK